MCVIKIMINGSPIKDKELEQRVRKEFLRSNLFKSIIHKKDQEINMYLEGKMIDIWIGGIYPFFFLGLFKKWKNEDFILEFKDILNRDHYVQ